MRYFYLQPFLLCEGQITVLVRVAFNLDYEAIKVFFYKYFSYPKMFAHPQHQTVSAVPGGGATMGIAKVHGIQATFSFGSARFLLIHHWFTP